MQDLLIFGAGASKDAGLPDTYELTRLALDRIRERDPQATGVLNFVIGALLFHASTNGGSPLATRVDAETLYRALEVLERRKDAELAAFVSSYHPHIDELDDPRPDSDVFGRTRRKFLPYHR